MLRARAITSEIIWAESESRARELDTSPPIISTSVKNKVIHKVIHKVRLDAVCCLMCI
ncbi:hypothetical protein D3C72_2535260 [compost metagenome]